MLKEKHMHMRFKPHRRQNNWIKPKTDCHYQTQEMVYWSNSSSRIQCQHVCVHVHGWRETKRSSYPFLRRQTVRRRGSERTVKCPIHRGKKALLSWEEDITLHPEQKGTKRAWRYRKEQTEQDTQRLESYQRKISARDKASRQGVVFSLFEASCHHH